MTHTAGKINGVSVSADGLLLSTTSDDKALKIFDVINFGEQFPSVMASLVSTYIGPCQCLLVWVGVFIYV